MLSREDSDVRISIEVQQGTLDVLVTAANRTQVESLASLPSAREKAKWSLEEVKSMDGERSLIIMQRDRKGYCYDCYYLIGINTRQSGASFTLFAQSLQAQKADSVNLLRVGVTKTVSLH
jgi:hypothetical protein